jgi:phosphatidylinositol alpha-1,6-mannosyltransferase
MNILFISRAYPPVIGGIEKQNYEISKALSNIARIDIIANRKGKLMLPLFLPFALIRTITTLSKYDAVLLGDGVLGIVGYLLKLVSTKPVVCIVHGLDLTYQNIIYQRLWIKIFLPRMDRLIAVGNATIHQGTLRGLPESGFDFIPNGVSIPADPPTYSRHDLETFLQHKTHGNVILTLGRLVKRKGIVWFLNNVFNRLDKDVTYLIAGEGPEKSAILAAIDANHLQDRVFLVGAVSDKDKELLFSTADIFVQPNIIVPGDMEGFGLVVLEAASYGGVVIASDLEGLKDAIQDGRNGFLISPYDAAGFKEKIETVLSEPVARKAFGQTARDHVLTNNSWALIAERYLEILTTVANHVNNS